MDPDSVVVVSVTTPPDIASSIAHALVEKRLAACVNIVPTVTSVYRWEDKVEEDQESLLLIKTTAVMFETVSATVRELHPYAVPEIMSTPIEDGYEGYVRWVRDNVGVQEPKDG